MIDGKRGKDALRFSRSLARNRFFSVLSRLLVGPVIIGLVYSILLAVVFMAIGAAIGFDPTTTLNSDQIPAWINLLESTFEIFLIPLVTVYMVMLYRNLKATVPTIVKE